MVAYPEAIVNWCNIVITLTIRSRLCRAGCFSPYVAAGTLQRAEETSVLGHALLGLRCDDRWVGSFLGLDAAT